MEGRLLPIGTVAMLKGGQKRVMIMGYCPVEDGDQEQKVYDYSGCIFPEGMISSKQILLFNQDQVEEVFHKGLVDEEQEGFMDKLLEFINEEGTTPEESTEVLPLE